VNRSLRYCGWLAGLAVLATTLGCQDDFASGPTHFTGALELRNWADTLVIGDRHSMTARLLDEQGREVLDRTFDWTVTDPSVLTLSASSTGDGDSVRVTTVRPGATQVAVVHLVDPQFEAGTASKLVSVVVAGVAVTTPDTTLAAVGDTAIVLGSALGHDSLGATVPLAGLGITWTKSGTATALTGAGDTVRVVAEQDGVDTLVATHQHCLAGASCRDTVVVTVAVPTDPEAGPTPGADVVVFNDINMWQNTLGGDKPENLVFFQNLVSFTGTGPRATGQSVLFYTGSASRCGANCSTTGSVPDGLITKLTSLGYTLINETGSLTSIPADVKLVFIWTPTATVGVDDVNALKQFAGQGGRVVVVGENAGYMGVAGIAAENQLLVDLGAQLTNQGGCLVQGEYAPAEGTHQLVAGVSQIFMACVSSMTPGPDDFVLFRASPGGEVVGAVAKIDLTLLPI
jgi:hypothetical protein